MSSIQISHPTQNIGEHKLIISGSKSESNRLLVLQYLLWKKKPLHIHNLSNSQDTELMQAALQSDAETIDIHHAGTAMRFLTAYFAVQEGRKTILTGSYRMKERPIGVLVDALRQLGAEIEYTEKDGFPPLKITGKKLTKNEVTLSASVSSQYISALLLIGIVLENGLTIHLEGEITSLPYLNMTIEFLNRVGIKATWLDSKSIKVMTIEEGEGIKFLDHIFIESDWSSASYIYSIMALAKYGDLCLSAYLKNSLQGDKVLNEIYLKYFNVISAFFYNGTPVILPIRIMKGNKVLDQRFELDLNNCPDIAQTILVTATALKIKCKLTGLHTLKIKETDRLTAMKTELEKCNVKVEITDDSIELISFDDLPKEVTISTYNDHRMAMAFAPLALMGVTLTIENHEVVEKSYPRFWEDLKILGFDIATIS